jgi:beta-1,4-mannosyl-glycoprotein beta-1,4-N-acetylglucosaminyltransferase
LDLLEIRLNSLAPYVDTFVISECAVTQNGNPKPLYFNDNKERFKDFNIVHLICDDGIMRRQGLWGREKHQRENLMNGIKDADPETMIYISDMDEIPNLENCDLEQEGAFHLKLYYYYLNVIEKRSVWPGTIAVRKKNINTIRELRDQRKQIRPIINDGWHFSWTGSIEDIFLKVKSFVHSVGYNLDDGRVVENIIYNRQNLIDPYRGSLEWGKPRKCVVEMPSGPKWLLENKDKYKHLFYEANP